jgi:hypothetical protein
MPKVEEFYPSRASLRGPQGLSTGSNDHLSVDGQEAAQFNVENEYEDDDENDAYEIVNPTRPRSRPRPRYFHS